MRISDWSSDVCSSDLEVIQYVYAHYGRDRAGLAAVVTSIRTKLAIRTVGRALGMSLDTIVRIAKTIHWWSKENYSEASMRDAGRSEERREGKECVSTCRSREAPYL